MLYSLYFDTLSVPPLYLLFWLSLLLFFLHSLLPSVSFVIAAVLQSQDALQTFRPNGRQLIEHVEAKL